MLASAFLAVSCVKILYFPSYKSTDFEVHRNWLAITSSLPLANWYVEDTSPWTLDYPPFFAWFEMLLSQVGVHFDPEMLKVRNLNYNSQKTILFQRFSVVVTDIVFALGAWMCAKNLQHLKLTKVGGVSKDTVVFLLLLTNVGLFIVDHIHFQYNGFLFGVLLISIGALMEEQFLKGGLMFAVLLNLKHIYVYIAPAYFVYLLRSFCFTTRSRKVRIKDFSLSNFIRLGGSVITIFGMSLGPFLAQLDQLVKRLFPFKRGLCHAYWAPNFWAVYNLADKGLSIAGRKAGYINSSVEPASMTGGLVQDIQHNVLPSISPSVTFVLVLLCMIPGLVKLWRSPYSAVQFIRCVTVCAWSSFLFGWHVHEKAILIVIVPLTILSVISKKEAKYFLMLSISGHLSLFPLLFHTQELYTKVFLHIFGTCLAWKFTKQVHKQDVLSWKDKFYVFLSLPLFAYAEFFHQFLGLSSRLPFLPLMMYSVYSALAVISTFIRFYAFYLKQ